MKNRSLKLSLVIFLCLALAPVFTWAHCEIPCGIYDDELRTKLIFEHTVTIEKSMKMIQQLGTQTPVDYNQLVRWVTNKEAHADKIQEIVSQYFLTQRIKPGVENYDQKLAVLHQMMVAAMKCKQTTDMAHVDTIRELLNTFKKLYFAHTHD